MVFAEVTWMFAVGVILATVVGVGLGANDLANMFGPSVGARALTLRQAVLVAIVFEATGAILMGSGVTSTIRNGIADVKLFTDAPDVLAYGMLCALLATALWMLLATYWEMPVSSTQAITAAVAAMAVVAKGPGSVKWWATSKEFPYMSMSMGYIAISWVVAPGLAAVFSASLYWVLRATVLRSSCAYQRSLALLPLFTCVTFFVVTFFIMEKGAPQYGWSKVPYAKKAWVSAIVAAGTTLIAAAVGVPLLRRRVERDAEAVAAARADAEAAKTVDDSSDDANHTPDSSNLKLSSSHLNGNVSTTNAANAANANTTPPTTFLGKMYASPFWRAATAGVNHDVHRPIEDEARVREIHESAEVFDDKAEMSFKYLQVCTACANAFAHGSNEVANAVGPLAAIYQVWQESAVKPSSPVPTWLLAIGAFGICFGLATYGHVMISAMGVKTTRLTNSRGFVVELCVAAVVILASRLSLPMSSTPATVGAIAGVGLFEGRKGINGRLLARFVASWALTIAAAIALTMAFAAQGLYAPNLAAASQRASVGAYLNLTATAAARAVGSEALLARVAAQKAPLLSLAGPMETQMMALTAVNATVWPAWARG